jgi:O-antigen/teichoic acid export membrane protein
MAALTLEVELTDTRLQSPPLEAQTAPPPRAHASITSSVARGSLALLSTQPLTWGATLLTTALVPQFLGAQGLGELTVLLTVTTLAAIPLSLGIPDYLVRRLAQEPHTMPRIVGTSLVIQMPMAVLGALALLVLGPLFAPSADPRLLYILLVGVLTAPAQNMLLTVLKGRERHRGYAWFNAAAVVSGQLIGVAALWAGAGLLVYAAIIVLSALVATAIGWILSGVRPTLPPLDRSLLTEVRTFARGGFPFLTSNMVWNVMSGVDRMLLGMFVVGAQVGWYAAANRIYAIPILIPTLVITPLFPALSRSVHDPDAIRSSIGKTLRVMLLLIVPMTAGLIVVAPAIPGILRWPEDFANAVPMMQVLSLQLPIMAVDMVLGVLLMAVGRQMQWVTVGIIAAIMKIVMDLVAIPVFDTHFGNGAIGASYVTLVSEFVMFFGAIVLIPKKLVSSHLLFDALRIGAAGVATVVVGVALLPISLILAILGGATAYTAVVIALRAVTRQDVEPILRLIPSR